MVDIESLRAVVAKGLKEYVGCPFIRSNQNAEPPDYPYGVYTITTVASENNGTYGEWEDGIARKGVNTVWSITVRSDDSIESVTLANKAREWLEYVGTMHLNDNGVIVQAVTSITNRDNVLVSDYEYANGFDCFFWCYDTIELSNVEVIESVVLNDEVITAEDYENIIADLNRRLDAANADLENIKLAIADMEVPITDETPTSEYASLIRQIETGKKEAVLYIEQELTDEQQEQARKNINAAKAQTDDDTIAMLIETDMLPAIHNTDGKILTDGSGRVILRY